MKRRERTMFVDNSPPLHSNVQMRAVKPSDTRYELRSLREHKQLNSHADLNLRPDALDLEQLRQEVSFWRAHAKGPAGLSEVAQNFQRMQATMKAKDASQAISEQEKHDTQVKATAEREDMVSKLKQQARELDALRQDIVRLKKERNAGPKRAVYSTVPPGVDVGLFTRSKVSRKLEEVMRSADKLENDIPTPKKRRRKHKNMGALATRDRPVWALSPQRPGFGVPLDYAGEVGGVGGCEYRGRRKFPT
ncbi:uncharacterized protein K460DRAFT_355719 [Cucurbitaria berberidis CBS 394.84]|uniref:Uncharacterized protein n=1 Tax=Cucurbitaria berberidis CBS 394.84 TaxID=1168544 RepID=A0A9P4GH23_9PLEO|nr:uncharacterized protein K460DRAFT_355719 [Cucurbitaria berberidis CBS 394.84]KAF1845983.1 hypothetical protein K460DRAFT_355719 [Cucurbitaria berberidis CBS 394.84]